MRVALIAMLIVLAGCMPSKDKDFYACAAEGYRHALPEQKMELHAIYCMGSKGYELSAASSECQAAKGFFLSACFSTPGVKDTVSRTLKQWFGSS